MRDRIISSKNRRSLNFIFKDKEIIQYEEADRQDPIEHEPLYVRPNSEIVENHNEQAVKVSVIVPFFNSAVFLKMQIDSWDNNEIPHEIIYVDDDSTDDSIKTIQDSWQDKKQAFKIIKQSNNGGFAAACNTGAKFATGEYLIFLNADCKVTPNWITPLLNVFETHPKAGIVGNLQFDFDDCIDSAGSEWSWKSLHFIHIGKTVYQGKRIFEPLPKQNMPLDLLRLEERQIVTGCCLCITKPLFDYVEGFDEGYRIGYWEDADLNLRVRDLGYKIYYQPESRIYHKGSHCKIKNHKFLFNNFDLFKRRWLDTDKLLDIIDVGERKIRPMLIKKNGNFEMKKIINERDAPLYVTGCVYVLNDRDYLAAFFENASLICRNFIVLIGGKPLDDSMDILLSLKGKYNLNIIQADSSWKEDELKNAFNKYLNANEFVFYLTPREFLHYEQITAWKDLFKRFDCVKTTGLMFNEDLSHYQESCCQIKLIKWQKNYHFFDNQMIDAKGHQVEDLLKIKIEPKLYFSYGSNQEGDLTPYYGIHSKEIQKLKSLGKIKP